MFSMGQESVTSAVRRVAGPVCLFGRPEPASDGESTVPNATICSTRAA